MKQVHS